VSINKNTNTAKMVSIPRDLWVKLDEQCSVGNESKINAVYECAAGLVSEDQSPSDYSTKDKEGATALMKTVTTVTGITPQYYAHVNYNVLKQAVDAVGGISVDIKGDGASGIYDTNFDWNCPNGQPYTCKNVYYPKDGTYELDGLHALYLARARADAGAYSYKDFGLARGDFDRQLNQQKIMTALKEKAQSAGVLSNPVAVFNLLNALGNNITTSISTGEMKTFLTTLQKLKPTDITSVDLNGDEPVVKTGSYAGQSVVLATSGINDYTSIITLIAKQLSTNPAVAEGANVAINNGGETAGAAGALQTKLTAGGLTITATGNADPSGSTAYTIYVAKPESFAKTIEYLTKNLTDATVVKTAAPSTIPTNDADIVIVINK
jgi:LCP family protein required for cell wall assembly